MALDRFPVVLVVLTFLWTFTRGDTDVSCVVRTNCILPCSFRHGADLVIHWIYLKRDVHAHSYYHDKDQLGFQDQQFSTRTSLFQSQIPRGNSSLLLRGVKVQDEGRYKCYTSTLTENMESFINLRVDAPIHNVNIHQEENLLTCSSEGIYPQPELVWSTSPPSGAVPPSPPAVKLTDEGLYSISSSLQRPDQADQDYTCSITTQTSSRRATLFKQVSVTGLYSETTIPCSEPSSHYSHLVWRYNHSQIILTQSGAESSYTATEQWRQHVDSVSESGSLTLRSLSSSHDGVYTCELSNDKETRISNTMVELAEEKHTAAIAAGVVVILVLLVIALIIGVVLWKRKQKKKAKLEQGDCLSVGELHREMLASAPPECWSDQKS